jgi:DNA-binding CsgD family transcriptional regulator
MGKPDQQQSSGPGAKGVDHLAAGRAAYARQAWDDAWRALCLADRAAPLAVEDLERLAMSAYLTSRDEDYLRLLNRAHHACLDSGDGVRAARAAFWLGLRLAFRGETGPASGWFRRAERMLRHEGRACVEEGYLLLPIAEQRLQSGDVEAAGTAAGRAAEYGDRYGDADLSACARHLQGRVLIHRGELEKGLALLDEAMVAVSTGELSPIMTGLIYCSIIEACQRVYAVDRTREWTSALAAWCAEQPQLIAFTSTCLVHRAEIMQINGDWQGALQEAARACAVCSGSEQAPAAALYQQAEVHRLRGEFGEAENLYRQAGRQGHEPQPGLALLRLAQGRTETAVTSIQRAMAATAGRLQRVALLPACVEIQLAAGGLEAAQNACRELEENAERFRTAALRGLAAHARGALALAEGDAPSALKSLGCAFERWQQIAAPYLAARTRELIGRACHALRDTESAELELAAAREAFSELGAAPDVARIDADKEAALSTRAFGLTRRELQVLRLVATGKTNKAIAAELCLSDRTVERHISNIFSKLNVSSRTAAAALAYRHRLI